MVTSITATEARRQLYKLVDQVQESHEPIQITGKRGNAVLVGEDDWRAVQETLLLVSIPGMRESIIEGMATPVDELEDTLPW
jgi:antitoxin YefM